MKLYLVRHGESMANINYDLLETVDDPKVPLTEKGFHDATHAGISLLSMLKEVDPDEVKFIVSPWLRTQQTFRVINGVLFNYKKGDFYGYLNDQVTEHYMNLVGNAENWAKFQTRRSLGWTVDGQMDVEYEGGESLRDVWNRAKMFLDTAKQGYLGKNVVLVSHGQFIKAILSHAHNTPPNNTHHPRNGEVIELDLR